MLVAGKRLHPQPPDLLGPSASPALSVVVQAFGETLGLAMLSPACALHDGVEVTYVALASVNLSSLLRAARTARGVPNQLINLNAAAS